MMHSRRDIIGGKIDADSSRFHATFSQLCTLFFETLPFLYFFSRLFLLTSPSIPPPPCLALSVLLTNVMTRDRGKRSTPSPQLDARPTYSDVGSDLEESRHTSLVRQRPTRDAMAHALSSTAALSGVPTAANAVSEATHTNRFFPRVC